MIMDKGFAEILDRLQNWSSESCLIELAFEGCRKSMIVCAKEDEALGLKPLHGWDMESIQLHFDKQSLVFNHGILSYPHLDTQIGLYVENPFYHKDLKPIGHYRLITTLDGKIDDDYFVLEEGNEDSSSQRDSL